MDTPQAMLDRLIQALGLENDSQLAKKLGVNRSTVGGWRSRSSIPITYFIESAQEANLNLNWLLLGEGNPERGAGDPPNPERPGLEGSSLQELWAAEGRAFKEDSDLGRRARLARLGRTRQAWMLLDFLSRTPREGRTLAALAAGVGSSTDEALSYLSLLEKAGLVTERKDDGESCFHLTSEFTELSFGDPADISEIGLEAIRHILKVVVPAAEREEGRLSVGVGRVRKGRSMELARSLVQFAKERCQETVGDPSEEEVVVVVGVAKASGAVLPSLPNPEGAKLS